LWDNETSGSSLLMIRDQVPGLFKQRGLILLFGPEDTNNSPVTYEEGELTYA